MEIIWKEPPTKKARGGEYTSSAKFAEALKANPGQWAFYGRKSTGLYAHLKKRYGLEVTSRNQENGVADIYARWVGESDV